jgi:hypothetical protein
LTEAVDIRGLEGALDILKRLPAELVSSKGGVVLTGLRKGATLVRKAWQAEVQRMVDEPNIAGHYKDIGLYKKSIGAKRVRNPKKYGCDEMVRVRVKAGAYPDGDRVAMVAGILEHGYEHMVAKAPFRKATDTIGQTVADAVVKGINDGIEKVIKQLDPTA